MPVQKHEHHSDVLAWIESKVTIIGEKARTLSLDFCGEISLLGLKDPKRADNLRELASRALHRQLGEAAIESLNPRTRKIALFAFAEATPDYPINDCLSEFMRFLTAHNIIRPNLCDVHCIKKGAWVGGYPAVVLTKLISSSVVILPVEPFSAVLAELISELMRGTYREPKYYESKSCVSTSSRRTEPTRRAVA